MKRRVCVIGGGAAGLCAARHLKATADFIPVVYEQSSEIGGTWVYDPKTGIDPLTQLPIHSSMYQNMKTNLPKEVMAFPDFPFPDSSASFLKHQQVRTYLEDYSQHFKLDSFLNLNHCVTSVKPVENHKWNVSVKNLIDSTQTKGKIYYIFSYDLMKFYHTT